MTEKQTTFTLAKHRTEGDLVHVSTVRPIDKHDYVCPYCEGDLVARCVDPEIIFERKPHFAHLGDTCGDRGLRHQQWLIDLQNAKEFIGNMDGIEPYHIRTNGHKWIGSLPIIELTEEPFIINGEDIKADFSIISDGLRIPVFLNNTDAYKRTQCINADIPAIRITGTHMSMYHTYLSEEVMDQLFERKPVPKPVVRQIDPVEAEVQEVQEVQEVHLGEEAKCLHGKIQTLKLQVLSSETLFGMVPFTWEECVKGMTELYHNGFIDNTGKVIRV